MEWILETRCLPSPPSLPPRELGVGGSLRRANKGPGFEVRCFRDRFELPCQQWAGGRKVPASFTPDFPTPASAPTSQFPVISNHHTIEQRPEIVFTALDPNTTPSPFTYRSFSDTNLLPSTFQTPRRRHRSSFHDASNPQVVHPRRRRPSCGKQAAIHSQLQPQSHQDWHRQIRQEG